MNKEKPIRDQAERLRQRIAKLEELEASQPSDEGRLPPRSSIHKSKKKKTKWKLKYPLIRLLVLFFILLPIVIYSIYSFNGNEKSGTAEPVTNQRNDYETVNLEKEESKDRENKADLNQVHENQNAESHELKDDAGDGIGNNPVNRLEDQNDKTAEVENKTAGSQTEKKDEKFIYHKVQPGETLFSIGMKYFQNQSGVEMIKQANGLQNDEIQAGQTLIIPLGH